MDEGSATNAEHALDEYNTESSGDDYGDDFELEEGMEQSDTNIDVAKVTEANEFNSGQPQVINSSSDSKDQVENGNIPLSTETTVSNDSQAQKKADKFVSDIKRSSSMKTGTRIQVTSTLGKICKSMTRDKARRKKRRRKKKILSTKDFCLFLVIQAKI